MSSSSHLVVELTPAWIAASIVTGGCAGKRSVEALDPEAWDSAWKAGLAAFDEPLKRCLAALPGHPVRAAALYIGPDTFTEVFSCPSHGREAQAAAMLALADQLSYVPSEGPHGAWVVGRDPQGLPAQTHMLLAAERSEAAEHVAAWLSRGGLTPVAQVPLEAPQIVRLVERALQLPTEGVHVALWIGSHRSCLGVMVGGRLVVSRRIELGLESLVTALIAADDTNDARSRDDRLTPDRARELLCSCGISDADDTIDRGRGLKGRHVLPVLQPVLQRFVVAIKQSLRFGVDEKDREAGSLVVLGPGSVVSRLGEILAQQTELTLATFDQPVGDSTDLGVALAATPGRLNLLPESVVGQRRRTGIRRALLVGAAAALAVCGIDAALTMQSISANHAQLVALRPFVEETQQRLDQRAVLASEAGAVDRTLRGVDMAMGIEPRWGAWLLELAAITPPTVRLLDIGLTGGPAAAGAGRKAGDAAGARVRLVGYLFAEPGEGSGGGLDVASYAHTLERSPMVTSVSLGETRRTVVDQREALQFTVTVMLTPSLDHLGQVLAGAEVMP